jgi:hypothetical protein
MTYIAFPFLADSTYTKPDKTNKLRYPTLNEQYHADFAKWCLFNANEVRHTAWLENVYRNKRYYMGHQWEDQEDIENFLNDETGAPRNRIQIQINQIRPTVEQFRGNAIRLAIGAKAKSISKNARVRKEEALKKALFTQDVASEFESLGEIIKSQNPEVQDTAEEQERIFENTYVDKYAKTINRLIEFSAEYNDMEEFQVQIAENMAFAGVGTIEEYKHGEHLRKEVVQPEDFFFDRNARRPDLQDAAYMGRVYKMSLPDIFERWQGLTQKERNALEQYVSANGNASNFYGPGDRGTNNNGNSVPVYKTFFMDSMQRTMGYVEDEFGQPHLVYLNEEDEFSDGKIWKESDLIDPPKTPKNKRRFKGKKKRNVVVGVLRYCIFIPGEAVNYRPQELDGKAADIVMEYGKYEYQENEWMDLSRNRYPLKSYCWSYIDGQIQSPIDDIIDPQRFLNRIMSAIEGQINNSGGTGLVYDKDMIDTQDDEMEILRNTNSGKPVAIRTRGKGVPNTIGAYDNTIKNGTYQMFNIIPQIQQLMQSITGVNEGLKGESTGSDQLVGVTQLMIQRGSLMQEPFYNAIARVFVQSHQATATFGKKIYAENEKELAQVVGDEGVEVFKLSKGMMAEDFRVFIKRSQSTEEMMQQADSILSVLLEKQLVDQKFFADMWGRSTIDDIQIKLREYTNKQIIAAEKAEQEQAAAAEAQAQADQEAMAAQAQMAQEQALQAEEMSAMNQQVQNQHDLEKVALKGVMDNQAAEAQGQEVQ